MDDQLPPPTDRRPKFSMKKWQGLLILVFGVTFGVQYWPSKPSVQQLPYSEFKATLHQGHIQKVQIGNKLIRGPHLVSPEHHPQGVSDDAVSRQPVRFTTIRVDDPALIHDRSGVTQLLS